MYITSVFIASRMTLWLDMMVSSAKLVKRTGYSCHLTSYCSPSTRSLRCSAALEEICFSFSTLDVMLLVNKSLRYT